MKGQPATQWVLSALTGDPPAHAQLTEHPGAAPSGAGGHSGGPQARLVVLDKGAGGWWEDHPGLGGSSAQTPPQVEVDPMRHVSTCNSVRRLSREGTLVDTGQLATAPGPPILR